MYSVDLAAVQFFKSIGIDCDFFVPFFSPRQTFPSFGKVKLRPYRNPSQLRNYQRVIIWGDFTTHPMYARNDYVRRKVLRENVGNFRWGVRQFTNALSKLDYKYSYEEWENLYLLAEEDEKPPVFLSIGQNFQSLTNSKTPYDIGEINKLYSRFDVILPRDSSSLGELKRLSSPKLSNVRLGMDCAFLLRSSSFLFKKRPIRRRLKIGYYFHRSRIQNVESLLSQIGGLQVDCFEIKGWIGAKPLMLDRHFRRVTESLRSCDLVISDTYHLLINTLILGTLAVGLGVKTPDQNSTVADYKKRVLFEDFGSSDLYVECEDSSLSSHEIGRIVDLISFQANQRNDHKIFQNIGDRRYEFEEFITTKVSG